MHTELDLVLRTLGVDTVFVAGIQTPNCIRTTVFDACALNYTVILVEDSVAAKNQDIHRANCRDREAIGIGRVRSGEIEGALRS